MNHALWQADPHQWGSGKIHIIDPENSGKSVCGKWLRDIPGRPVNTGKSTCQSCLSCNVARENRKEEQIKFEAQQTARKEAKEEHDRQWWERYNVYLLSPEWRTRKELVHKRAGGVCEGCGLRPVDHVHHLTYTNVCNEFLWELRGVCLDCHQRLHPHRDFA